MEVQKPEQEAKCFPEFYLTLEESTMKLPIKKKWFDQIKSGKKTTEYREAHITFVCEETGEKLTVPVKSMFMTEKRLLPTSVRSIMKEKYIMAFDLGVPSSNNDFKKVCHDCKSIMTDEEFEVQAGYCDRCIDARVIGKPISKS